MTERLEVGELLRQLHEAGIEYILIGGLAVNARVVIRATKDVDICPSPDPANLERLSALLRHLDVRQLGVGDEGFAEPEMSFDPTRADDLAQGGTFGWQPRWGVLYVMQWIPGIEAESAYEPSLRTMKRAAGRPQDLVDLAALEEAHPDKA